MCKLYFITFLSEVPRESSALTGIHKLSLQDGDVQIVLYVFRSFQGSCREIFVRFVTRNKKNARGFIEADM